LPAGIPKSEYFILQLFTFFVSKKVSNFFETIILIVPRKCPSIVLVFSLPDSLRMNSRPVGQDLPTKEGHGGLGPETHFLGRMILAESTLQQNRFRSLFMILFKLHRFRQSKNDPCVSRWNARLKSLNYFQVPYSQGTNNVCTQIVLRYQYYCIGRSQLQN
jgi:hypothetical protein